MQLIVDADGFLLAGERRLPCALGKGGRRLDKREGDGATPIGSFPLRQLFWRADRLAEPPRTRLPAQALTERDGWCDDPSHADYNRQVALPFPASHETLWRDDAVYDLIVPLGYNDGPILPGAGSAIFLHVAREGFSGTEGCVALRRDDLLSLLPALGPDSILTVLPPERA